MTWQPGNATAQLARPSAPAFFVRGRFGHEATAVEEGALFGLGRFAFDLQFLGRGIVAIGKITGTVIMTAGHH